MKYYRENEILYVLKGEEIPEAVFMEGFYCELDHTVEEYNVYRLREWNYTPIIEVIK